MFNYEKDKEIIEKIKNNIFIYNWDKSINDNEEKCLFECIKNI